MPTPVHTSSNVADQPTRAAYSPAEFAELLGVTRQHVHALINRGEIHSVKLGRSRRIPASELDRILGNTGGGHAA